MAARLDLSSPITSSKLSLKSSHLSLSSSSSRQTTWSPPFKGSTSRLSKSTSAPNKPSTRLRFPPCALPPGALPPGLRTVSSSAVPRVAASAAAASAADFPAAGSGPDEPPFNLNPEELQEELSRAFRSAKKQSKVALRKIADGTAGALRCAQSKVAEFERDNDLRGKAREAVGAANERLEEVAFEAERHAFRFDAQFGVSSRVEEMKRAVVGAAYDVDCNLRIRQRMRDMIKEIQYQLPKYLKRWAEFRTTPAGQLVMFVAFAWLLISGWLAQIFLWSLCIVPLLPLLARALAKAAFVEGDCPSCGVRFIGPRRELLICRGCHHVVWTPKGWASPRKAQSSAAKSTNSGSSNNKGANGGNSKRSARGVADDGEVDIIDVVAISPAGA